jgi:primosomal protein N' (replication factor Y) (superfamily II helicase)
MTRVADVAFDAPLPHPFSYRVPEDCPLVPGQRVMAPLRGAPRMGVVVAVREGSEQGLKRIARVLDGEPRLDGQGLALARWIADQSLGSFGSTCLALLPPPVDNGGPCPSPPAAPTGADAPGAELLIGAGRESRLIEHVAAGQAPTLVLTPDVEAASRWAQRLGKHGAVGRLDSGAGDADRAAGWAKLEAGTVKVAVGTRSALLAPLPAGGTLALIDEHDVAHKPPGPPRLHSREVVLERAARQGLRAVLTSATPSVETWWRAESGQIQLERAPKGSWPGVIVADTRGIARREALTPALARAIREALATGRRVFLGVSRLTSALGCDECGAIVKCRSCGIALAYSPAGRTLSCRLCGGAEALPETCAGCQGRRLAPFGWGAERVEHAVRRRFARARIARYDAETRGHRAEAQRAAALGAEIVVGTRGALRLFGPGSLGLAGFVSPDQLLGLPDFRSAERVFDLLWAAAERVRPDGCLLVQSQNPTHYALQAVGAQELALFYRPELRFRAELGYPPFRRLALLTSSGPDAATARALAEAAAAALAGAPGLTAYPPTPDRRQRTWRLVVKGGPELPVQLATTLGELARRGGPRSRGIMDVEVDPVEWPC